MNSPPNSLNSASDKGIMMEINNLLDSIRQISSITNNNRLSFDKKMDQLLLVVVECLEAKNGSILLINRRSTLEVAASTRKELKGLKQKLAKGTPSEWVVSNRRYLYVDDKENNDSFIKRFDLYEGSAFFMAPILLNGRVIGIISVTDKLGSDLFTKEEREALLDIAGLLIGSIETQRMARLLKKKKSELTKKNKELQAHEKLKSELFNMLIHDLKGPISAVTANLDILAYTIDEKNREFVDTARNGCDTLYNMICNLLDITRMEDGNLKLLFERIDPVELVREAINRISGLAAIKKINLLEKRPDYFMNYFWGDRALLIRVLMNFISNAISFSPEGETIETGFDMPDNGKIEFFVKDHGPGVPEKHRDSIFNKYYQLKKKRDGRIHTTGLGLTFCKMAVEAHSGKIGIVDNRPHGSCFYFKIHIDRKKRKSV